VALTMMTVRSPPETTVAKFGIIEQLQALAGA
jgi:hypothetical protein